MTCQPGSWCAKLNATVFELNNAKNRITGVSPFFGMFSHNPPLPLDVSFPHQTFQQNQKWTKYVENLSTKFVNTHNKIREHELHVIPTNQEIKSPRGKDFIKIKDLVYQFHPQAVLNFSRKLTLRWIGPFHVVDTLSPSLSVIFPVGDWVVNKREIKTLTSCLTKIDPAHSQMLREKVDLDQLTGYKGEDVILQPTLESNDNSLREGSESKNEIKSESENVGEMPCTPLRLILKPLPPQLQDQLKII